jgi:gamma-glutamyl hercynylcysteine S-oxide synthase
MSRPSLVGEERWPTLLRQLQVLRDRTLRLIDPLDEDALERQHNEIMSPLVWDVGHIGNFEELWLLRVVGGHAPHDEHLDRVYNPFENPRWCRGDLDFLRREQALAYLSEVRQEAVALAGKAAWDDALVRDGYVLSMVAQHEAQHQETMLQALDLRDDLEPYPARLRRFRPTRGDDTDAVFIPGGEFQMGTDDRADAYDNERPRHQVMVEPFAIDRYPVTVRRYARFVDSGGYQDPELWTADGWYWLSETGHSAPQGWVWDMGGGWLVRRFGTMRPLDPTEPVQHVSFHEAEAFARWAGGRLPTEAEWEKAASWDPATGESRRYPWGHQPPTPERANLGQRHWGPAPIGSFPAGASALGVEQMLGDVYEWTASAFRPYPGYETFPYPEYSEVFFEEDYPVLRGASWATSPMVARNTFRNWDLPIRRQIFAGFRLAWDVTVR